MVNSSQNKQVASIKMDVIRLKQRELDNLHYSLNKLKTEYVKLASILSHGDKVIVKPRYGRKFYGIVDTAVFDYESDFNYVSFYVKPVKKNWVQPDGYNRRYSVIINRKSELLHVEK